MLKRPTRENEEEADDHDRWEAGRCKESRPYTDSERSGCQCVRSSSNQTSSTSAAPPSSKTEGAVKMSETYETQFPNSAAKGRHYNSRHLVGDGAAICVPGRQRYDQHSADRKSHPDDNSDIICDRVDEIRSAQLSQKRGDDIGEKNYTLRHIRANEIEGSRQDDDVENIVDEACKGMVKLCLVRDAQN